MYLFQRIFLRWVCRIMSKKDDRKATLKTERRNGKYIRTTAKSFQNQIKRKNIMGVYSACPNRRCRYSSFLFSNSSMRKRTSKWENNGHIGAKGRNELIGDLPHTIAGSNSNKTEATHTLSFTGARECTRRYCFWWRGVEQDSTTSEQGGWSVLGSALSHVIQACCITTTVGRVTVHLKHNTRTEPG